MRALSIRGCLLLSALLVTFQGNAEPSRADTPGRPTLAQRVEAETAVQHVYWSHRIWPVENPGGKPSFEETVSKAQVRAIVEDSLAKSSALEGLWKRPITHAQVQAEIDRIARDSKDPALLHELFAALDNDPSMIAETLARRTLADRLIRNWYARDQRFHGDLRACAERELAAQRGLVGLNGCGGEYIETEWRVEAAPSRRGSVMTETRAVEIDRDEWLARRRALQRELLPSVKDDSRRDDDAALPVGRRGALVEDDAVFRASVVLEDRSDRMRIGTVIWRKRPFDEWWRIEADAWTRNGPEVTENSPQALAAAVPAYVLPNVEPAGCAADSWTSFRTDNPEIRFGNTAVWTGSEMIVWGGIFTDYMNSGSRYNPATDTWTPTSIGSNVPSAREQFTAVWTGAEMIVWGGTTSQTRFNSGGRYNPVTDSWSPTSMVDAPERRAAHTAVWTGSEMIVWGGYSYSSGLSSGARYDPAMDSWSPTSMGVNLPSGRYFHSAVWTGSRMIVWGGDYGGNTGGRYEPATNSWLPTSLGAGVPSVRTGHSAVWTGSEMIIWGGANYENTGSRYNPTTDIWSPTSTGANVPAGRAYHEAQWTGSVMVVWGGYNGNPMNTGGRYNPQTNSWTTMSMANVPEPRYRAVSVWTGSELIVWGGSGSIPFISGGRYDPSNDTWVPTSMGGTTPSGRDMHAAVWTGSEMIVWGGRFCVNQVCYAVNTGGRYDPGLDTWRPTSMDAATPSARSGHTAVWTGSRLIVWGGGGPSYNATNTGALYDPASDVWSPTSLTNASGPRVNHTAIWTGSQMIVWGGSSDTASTVQTGGRYTPGTGSWSGTSIAGNVPAARAGHVAVWTGSEMLVWGGSVLAGNQQSGGRYKPATDTWTPMSITASTPSGRYRPAFVWSGTEMIVWGGENGSWPFEINTGGRYHPATDAWTPTPLGDMVPSPRRGQAAVWTGSEMVVWGGIGFSIDDEHSYPTRGGRFEPVGNAWVPTVVTSSTPPGRYGPSVVWTGRRMMVWGGSAQSSGGAYCPYRCGIFYRDADGDEYGTAAMVTESCTETVPVGYVDRSGDCDDARAAVHPGGREACDGLRDDCGASGWPALLDADDDGTEDACESCSDADGDGYGDPQAAGNTCVGDDCPAVVNPGQLDQDRDGAGDACDPCPHDPLDDLDNDGLCGDHDNCPFTANPPSDCDGDPSTPAVQCDEDDDGIGSACDDCPTVLDRSQLDRDADGTGDLCDDDRDGDGTLDSGVDLDGDGVTYDANGSGSIFLCHEGAPPFCDDNCRDNPNPGQEDEDVDFRGDACDFFDGMVQQVVVRKVQVPHPWRSMSGDRVDVLVWAAEVGAVGYNVYSGAVVSLPQADYGSCYRRDLATSYAVLSEDPPPGTATFYLVTAIRRVGEGSLGRNSSDNPRINAHPCD